MSLLSAAGHIHTLAAQPGRGLSMIMQEPQRQDLPKKLNRIAFLLTALLTGLPELRFVCLQLPETLGPLLPYTVTGSMVRSPVPEGFLHTSSKAVLNDLAELNTAPSLLRKGRSARF